MLDPEDEELEFVVKCKMTRKYMSRFYDLLKSMERNANYDNPVGYTMLANAACGFKPKFEFIPDYSPQPLSYEEYNKAIERLNNKTKRR